MNFGEMGEEKFAQKLTALKEVIAKRQNQSHCVKLIVTTLADGAWGDGHNGVNIYMASHWEKVADQITALVKNMTLTAWISTGNIPRAQTTGKYTTASFRSSTAT